MKHKNVQFTPSMKKNDTNYRTIQMVLSTKTLPNACPEATENGPQLGFRAALWEVLCSSSFYYGE